LVDVVVVGDGAAGLSAALFLAKNGLEVVVLGEDKTDLHYAYLYNYLGVKEIHGDDLARLGREQAASFGADLQEGHVTVVKRSDEGFHVETEDGRGYDAKYVVMASGADTRMLRDLGAQIERNIVQVDRDGRTTVENLYAAGRITRRIKIQAVISAGDGAAAALDILSKERGRDVRDFDEPPK